MHCVQIPLSNVHAKAAHQMSLWTCFSEETKWRAEMVRVEHIDEWKESWTRGVGVAVVVGNLISKKMKKEINKN